MVRQQKTTPEVPVVRLDPNGTDHQGEAAELRRLGPVVRVILPGGVPAWEVTLHEPLAALIKDPLVSRNSDNWNLIKKGEISDDWPLIGMIRVTNMATADGADHHRLRRLVTKTFTVRRVQAMRPRIVEIIDKLLTDLPGQARGGVVDLRRHFAYPVPMQVICELIGAPEEWRPKLRDLVDSMFRTDTSAAEVLATQRERVELLRRLIALRTQAPGDDLTSALIEARREEPGALTSDELADTLWLMLSAGHETSISLILNAVRALLTHPRQLALALAGDESTWAAVVEETLRWDASIGNVPARYPLTDIEIGGVTIPAGDAILAGFSAAGRDPQQHGPDAGSFDITRAQRKHLAFGDGGPHMCPGASLARHEATLALQALFTRYPGLTLAVPADTLSPVPSMLTNSVQALPVRLSPDQAADSLSGPQ